MKTLRIGMLGYGSMGHTHHYAIDAMRHFYPDLPYRAEIVRLCARSESTLDAARAAGIPEVTTREDDILTAPDIDIVDICTPNVYHAETARRALEAGKHIYCEKPLCVTADEARGLAALAEMQGVVNQVVFNTRFLPAIRRAKQLCDEGALGRILSFRCAYLHASCTDPEKPAGWKQNRDICGGGVWFDLGSHAVDLIFHLCGPIAEIRGHGQIGHPVRRGADGGEWVTNADEAFYAFATLQNGACGTFEANKLALGANDDLTLELYGDRGAIRFSLMEPNWLWFYSTDPPAGDFGGMRGFTRIECVGRVPAPAYPLGGQKAPVGWLRGHMESYHSFLDCVAAGRQASPSFAEAAHVQWALCRAMESER